MVKCLPTMWWALVQSLGWEDFLEKTMAAQSSILACKIQWTEEPGRLQSLGSQRVRHNWATSLSLFLTTGPPGKSKHWLSEGCSCSVAFNSLPWSVALQAPLSTRFFSKSTWVACHFLLQGIFPDQGWNSSLLRWQADSLPLSHQGSPIEGYFYIKFCCMKFPEVTGSHFHG